MTMDHTTPDQDPQTDDTLAVPDAEHAASAAPHDPVPRSHWDKVLAAVQERS